MSYFYYSSVCFFLLVTTTAIYLTRAHWLHHVSAIHLPGANYIYSQLPNHHSFSPLADTPYSPSDPSSSSSSFAADIEAGLSSASFDLVSNNLSSDDPRAGLDDKGKAEVLRIMKKRRMTFDQARKIYMEQRFKANGIGPDGLPRDPKFVSFS